MPQATGLARPPLARRIASPIIARPTRRQSAVPAPGLTPGPGYDRPLRPALHPKRSMASIDALLRPHVRDLGGGFTVRRVLPGVPRRTVGPFIFFDHMGPVRLPPGEGLDVRPHPHIGLATVTWLFDGGIVHRDSLGYVQPIAPGDVNWMTAGRGIVHSERSAPESRTAGPALHGLQTWVALPRADEEMAPGFVHVPARDLPVLEPEGARIVVVAGGFLGASSPTPTRSSTLYASVTLEPGARLTVPAEHEERAIYPVDVAVDVDGVEVPPAHLAVLAPGVTATITAGPRAQLMLVGGAALEGERHIWWNFVSSSRERIEQAKADWREGRFAKVPGETEFIPLPDR